MKNTFLNSFCFTILFLLLCLFSQSVFPQNTQSTDNKADKNLKSSVRVNPSTLAMELTIPFASYPGRSGNNLPVAINYSSKVWRVNSGFTWWTQTPLGCATIWHTDVRAQFAEKTIAGWTSSLLPPRLHEKFEFFEEDGNPFTMAFSESQLNEIYSGDSNLLQAYACSTPCYFPSPNFGGCLYWGPTTCRSLACNAGEACDPGSGWGSGGGGGCYPPDDPQFDDRTVVKRIHIQMPDGATHEFRKDDKIHPYCNDPNNPNCDFDTGTFLSVDGTGMRLERGVILAQGEPARDVLYLPNGSRYIFSNTYFNEGADGVWKPAEKLIDVNGNHSYYNASQSTWTDTVGRQIADSLPARWTQQARGVGIQEVNLPSQGNGTLNYKIKWENLTDVFDQDLPAAERTVSYWGNVKCNGNLGVSLSPYLFSGGGHNTRMCNSATDTNGNAAGFHPVVMSEVELPSGQKYKFRYNRYGEITRLDYPTESYERFTYGYVPTLGIDTTMTYEQANRGVLARDVYYKNGTLAQHWEYNVNDDNSPYRVITTAPDGTKTERYLHKSANSRSEFDDPRAGMPYDERSYSAPDPNTNQRYLMSRRITGWGTWTLPGAGQVGQRDARVDKEFSIIFEPSEPNYALVKMTDYLHDYDGINPNVDFNQFPALNVKEIKRYDFLRVDRSTAETQGYAYFENLFYTQGRLLTTENIEYKYDANYAARGIHGLVNKKEVVDNTLSGNPIVAKSEVVYDEAAYAPLTYGATACWANPSDPARCWTNPATDATIPANSRNLRGQVTTSRVWLNTTNSWINTHAQTDQFGNGRKTWDALGRVSQVLYDANPTGSVANPQNYAYVYAIKTIAPPAASAAGDPHGSNEAFTAEATFDLMTGLPLTSKDVHGQITTTQYNDPLLRPTKVIAPNGAQAVTEYGDTPGNLFVRSLSQTDENTWAESQSYMDEFGRTWKTRTKDAAGDIFVYTCYDTMGRVKKVSNPIRNCSFTTPCISTDASLQWTESFYDLAGRPVGVKTPDNVVSYTGYSLATHGNAVGIAVTTKDAAGKMSRSVTDSQGLVVRVDEPSDVQVTATPTPLPSPSPTPDPTPDPTPTPDPCPPLVICQPQYLLNEDNVLGPVNAPRMSTFYRYDGTGKMVKVEQGGQSRFFLYDSLGRLLRVRQPEQDAVNAALNNLTEPVTGNNQWTAGFTYDNAGNLLTATDAKGVVITSVYDNLNRVKTRSYSVPAVANPNDPVERKKYAAATSAVSYKYDGLLTAIPGETNPPVTPVAFAKGKLTEVKNDESLSQSIEFDNLGRALRTRQITRFDDSQSVTSGQIYTSSYKYNLSGALVEQTYPSGRVVRNVFNADGDLAAISSRKTVVAGYRTLASDFAYTASGAIERLKIGNGRWESAKFNARLQITELALGTSPTDGSLWKVNYHYGELESDGTTVNTNKNNGNIAKQTISFTGLSAPYVQTYRYDSLHRLTEARETTAGSQNWKQTWSYDRFGNRTQFNQWSGTTALTFNDNQQRPTIRAANNRFNDNQGYIYDYNGNLISDAENRSFVFNADNKQVEVKDSTNQTVIGKYYYDGDGKRVRKVTATGEVTVFVYDGGGKLVAEYDNNFNNPPPAPTTSYVATDTLQSVRVITNQQGEVTSRRDFMPFGEELFANSPNRTETSKYSTNGNDRLRKRFTGYEKDTETGLDFAEARYYQNKHGRFTAVDPLLASGKSGNPQTFNRYTYVLNNPIILTDPNGLQAGNNLTPCRGANCGDYSVRGNVATPDNPLAQFTIWMSDNVVAPITDYVFNVNTLNNVNYQRSQDIMNATNGDPEAFENMNRKVFGYTGLNVHSTLQATTDHYSTAYEMANIGLTAQSVVFGFAGMVGPGRPTVATNRGGTPLFGNAAVESNLPRYEMVKVSELRFTEKFHKPTWKLYANDAISNGIKEPIRFVEFGGDKFIVQGNNKAGWAMMRGQKTLLGEQTSLPFRGFKSEADLFDIGAPTASRMRNDPVFRHFKPRP